MKVYYSCLYIFLWSVFITSVLANSGEVKSPTVKKQLNNSLPIVDHPPQQFQQQEQPQEAADAAKNKTDRVPAIIHDVVGRRPTEDYEIPDSFRVGFYIFIGLGLLAIFFIVFRSYKLRLSRAERRYGVQGDRSAQELTPLPIAIEEDSDNEDQTLFEINRQARVS